MPKLKTCKKNTQLYINIDLLLHHKNAINIQAKEEVPLHLDEDELDWSEENPFEAERRKKKEALQAEAKALSKELKVSFYD